MIILQERQKPWRNWPTCVVFFVVGQAVWRLPQSFLMMLPTSLCQNKAAGMWLSSGMSTVGRDPRPSPDCHRATSCSRRLDHFHLCEIVYWLISTVHEQLKEQKQILQHKEKGRGIFFSVTNWSILTQSSLFGILKSFRSSLSINKSYLALKGCDKAKCFRWIYHIQPLFLAV